MMDMIIAMAGAAGGAVAGSLLGWVPALHVYNVLGFAALSLHAAGASSAFLPAVWLLPATLGLIVGWSMANTIPSIFLAAPDESALLMVLPGQKYALAGRGYEAAMLTAAGSLGALVLLVAIAGPLAPLALPVLRAVLQPHQGWILWTVIVFLLMSEWPRFGTRGQGGWRKFLSGWSSTGAGLLTFLLSGLLGFILRYRSPLPVESAFQNLLPAFAGLFAVPWLLLNLVSGAGLPEQELPDRVRIPRRPAFRGVGAGMLGGAFAAFFPGITGGIGGLLAGHATAQRDERTFLISQGASKMVYYAGALLLFAVPGESLARGTGAWLLRGFLSPRTSYEYYMALGSLALAGAVAFLLFPALCRLTILALRKIGLSSLSAFSLVLIVALVEAATGWRGQVVLLAAAGIGLIPVLFHSRRINALGVILLPMACGMSGIGIRIAELLGLR